MNWWRARSCCSAPTWTPMRKARGESLKVSKHSPEKLLGQNSLARMGESIATRRGRAANCRERTTMKPQRVTHIIQTNGVGQLCVEHRHHMAPSRKRSAGFVHPGLPRQPRHKMGRNELAELAQNAELRCRWAGLFFTPCQVVGLNVPVHQTFNFCKPSVGRL
jgi:hypothetical protein